MKDEGSLGFVRLDTSKLGGCQNDVTSLGTVVPLTREWHSNSIHLYVIIQIMYMNWSVLV